jgi:hypothetical protein
MVWLTSWDCKGSNEPNRASMLHYEPSTAPLPTKDGGAEVVGQFATLAIGYVVFQVFTVDYVEAEVRKAVLWNTNPPPSVAPALHLIWPHRLYAADVQWPTRTFPYDSFDQLASWDGALRRPA